MMLEKKSETEYLVLLYDWDNRHDDYLAGTVKRYPDDEDSDRFYFRFYPSQFLAPICASDLSRLSKEISKLNSGLED